MVDHGPLGMQRGVLQGNKARDWHVASKHTMSVTFLHLQSEEKHPLVACADGKQEDCIAFVSFVRGDSIGALHNYSLHQPFLQARHHQQQAAIQHA